jgi:hypothetical protein
VRVNVTIKHTQTATIDIGTLPILMVQRILQANDGTFDGNYSLGDVPGSSETWTVESVEVAQASSKDSK